MKNNTEYEEGSSSDRLYRANAKVISNSECQEHYTNTIRSSDLCARVIEHDDNTPQGVCRVSHLFRLMSSQFLGTNSECVKMLLLTIYVHFFNKIFNFQGDSGGPLVHKHNTIIGIVSGISMGCNENNEPGIYCRVSSHMSFIRNAMKDSKRRMKVKEF